MQLAMASTGGRHLDGLENATLQRAKRRLSIVNASLCATVARGQQRVPYKHGFVRWIISRRRRNAARRAHIPSTLAGHTAFRALGAPLPRLAPRACCAHLLRAPHAHQGVA